MNLEQAVLSRYSSASQAVEPSLCCPVNYDPKYLEVLPAELIERDYGCGDPSTYVDEGDIVLDLGSGGGKICYIASQVVGPEGRVWGVDMNDEMLALARKHQQLIGERIGYQNVRFFKGRIQDLGLDLDKFETYLRENPVDDAAGWSRAQNHANQLRRDEPMIPSDEVDVIVSNCVLNLVDPDSRSQLFSEMFRVLRRGGRAVISDIVCDEPVPHHMQQDRQLWSGCISGAYLEQEFQECFLRAGFYGIEIVDRPDEPWAVVEGIEFRGVTVRAYKGKEGPCLDHKEAVIYRGPWSSVTDDDGHVLRRGEPMAVCRKTFEIYTNPPYGKDVSAVPPRNPIPESAAQPFDCHESFVRSAKETKGPSYSLTQLPDSSCCGNRDQC